MRELPERKPNRLKGYDYSQNGAYFVTICVRDRRKLLGGIVVPQIKICPQMHKQICPHTEKLSNRN